VKQISLTQGKVALVDDADFERVSKWKWFVIFDDFNWYAKRKWKGKLMPMSNFVLDLPIGVRVDHANRKTLDNQRRNLRICTYSQNCRNAFSKSSNSSGFKGVSWKKANKKWCAQIKTNGTVKHLGLFESPHDAALAYDAAALAASGEFALTNAKLGFLK
jgi:hypothetical protein